MKSQNSPPVDIYLKGMRWRAFVLKLQHKLYTKYGYTFDLRFVGTPDTFHTVFFYYTGPKDEQVSSQAGFMFRMNVTTTQLDLYYLINQTSNGPFLNITQETDAYGFIDLVMEFVDTGIKQKLYLNHLESVNQDPMLAHEGFMKKIASVEQVAENKIYQISFEDNSTLVMSHDSESPFPFETGNFIYKEPNKPFQYLQTSSVN